MQDLLWCYNDFITMVLQVNHAKLVKDKTETKFKDAIGFGTDFS